MVAQNTNETPELFTEKTAADTAETAEAAPKRRTSRRVTANTEELKEATEKKPATRTRKTAAKADADDAKQGAEDAKKTTRARATTKTAKSKTAASKTEADEAAGVADTEAAASEAEADTAAEKKPATRARRASTKKAAKAEADAAAETAEGTEAADAEEKPKRASTRRKQSKDSDAQSADAQSQDKSAQPESGDAAAAAEESAAPARGRRGRGKAQQAAANDTEKSADDTGNETKPESPADDKAQADDKPARGRRGRGRKQDADSQGADDANENGADKADDASSDSGDQQNQQSGSRRERSSRSRTRQRDRNRRGHSEDDMELTSDDVLLPIAGVLDVLDNYAFVRTTGYLPGVSDVYVSLSQVKRFELRKGDAIVGAIRQPRENEQGGRQKYNAIVKIDSVNGQTVEESAKRATFDALTPIRPDQGITLAQKSDDFIARALDLFAPAAFGQRGVLTALGNCDYAEVFTAMANGVSAAQPEAHIIYVHVGGRPEDATELTRSVNGEVVIASSDTAPEDQLTVVELALERAKRLVELGHDVFLFVDSLSAVAQSLYLLTPSQHRTLHGVEDPTISHTVKRLFSSARNVENGGSLAVYAAVDKYSDVYQTISPIANWTVSVNESAAVSGVFSNLQLEESFARNSELLQTAVQAAGMARLRQKLAESREDVELSEWSEEFSTSCLKLLKETVDNDEFLVKLAGELK